MAWEFLVDLMQKKFLNYPRVRAPLLSKSYSSYIFLILSGSLKSDPFQYFSDKAFNPSTGRLLCSFLNSSNHFSIIVTNLGVSSQPLGVNRSYFGISFTPFFEAFISSPSKKNKSFKLFPLQSSLMASVNLWRTIVFTSSPIISATRIFSFQIVMLSLTLRSKFQKVLFFS